LRCPACDTEYLKDAKERSIQDISDEVQRLSVRGLVVITGGEPLRQTIPFLCRLLSIHHHIQIETNGTFWQPLPWTETTIVCSPKNSVIDDQLLPRIQAFKYVVRAGELDPNDGLPIAVMGFPSSENSRPARPPIGFKGQVYLSPLDEKNTKKNMANTKAAVDSCLTFGHILSLQIHKIIGVE